MPIFKQWREKVGVVVLLSSFSFLFSAALVPLPAQAQGLVPCGPDNAQNAGNVSGCTINDLFVLGARIFNFLLGLAAVVAILIIIIAGLGMITYHWFENPDQVLQNARYTLTRAITGLIIVAIAYILVNTVVFVLTGKTASALLQSFGVPNVLQ